MTQVDPGFFYYDTVEKSRVEAFEEAARYIEAQAKSARDTYELIAVQSSLPIKEPVFSCEGLRQMADTIRSLASPQSSSVHSDVEGRARELAQGLRDTARWIRARDPLATNYLYCLQAAEALSLPNILHEASAILKSQARYALAEEILKPVGKPHVEEWPMNKGSEGIPLGKPWGDEAENAAVREYTGRMHGPRKSLRALRTTWLSSTRFTKARSQLSPTCAVPAPSSSNPAPKALPMSIEDKIFATIYATCVVVCFIHMLLIGNKRYDKYWYTTFSINLLCAVVTGFVHFQLWIWGPTHG